MYRTFAAAVVAHKKKYYCARLKGHPKARKIDLDSSRKLTQWIQPIGQEYLRSVRKSFEKDLWAISFSWERGPVWENASQHAVFVFSGQLCIEISKLIVSFHQNNILVMILIVCDDLLCVSLNTLVSVIEFAVKKILPCKAQAQVSILNFNRSDINLQFIRFHLSDRNFSIFSVILSLKFWCLTAKNLEIWKTEKSCNLLLRERDGGVVVTHSYLSFIWLGGADLPTIRYIISSSSSSSSIFSSSSSSLCSLLVLYGIPELTRSFDRRRKETNFQRVWNLNLSSKFWELWIQKWRDGRFDFDGSFSDFDEDDNVYFSSGDEEKEEDEEYEKNGQRRCENVLFRIPEC